MIKGVVRYGDCREIMRRWIASGIKVQMCVTSPPYFGLRDYGVAGQVGLESTPEEYVAGIVATFPPDLIAPCILAGAPINGIVLDPFIGSGTTAEVALSLGRRYLGCELNPAYESLINKRVAKFEEEKAVAAD
jgi:DNA modification methylase